jgi:hypothetical protein
MSIRYGRALLGAALLSAMVLGVTAARASADDPVANGRATSVDEALAAAPFPVARPAQLPFAVTSSFGMRDLSVPRQPRFEQTYVSADGYISITALRGKLDLKSRDYEVTGVTMPDGTSARFMDNGVAQVLVFSRGEVSYHMAASRKDGKTISPDELVRIAASMR